MVDGNLNTTNILLGIMAAVSVLQALVLVGIAVFAFRLYRQALITIREIEQRRIAPIAAQVHAMMARVDAIVGDVKDVTGRVTRQTERVDSAIHHTMHRVDETSARMRESIGSRISQLMGLVHGAICAVQGLFTGRRASTEAPAT
jgi:methyl-accepting chemotaxis protein